MIKLLEVCGKRIHLERKTEEELKNMDLEQFKELTTSETEAVVEARIYGCAESFDEKNHRRRE